MRLQSLIVTGVAAASVLALTACNPAKIGEHRNERPMVAAVRLDCPDRQGDLTRVSVAGDGRSCAYTGDAGEQVTLQLIALNAKPAQAVLAELEAELKQGAASPSALETANQDGSSAAPAANPSPAGGDVAAATDAAGDQAKANAGSDSDENDREEAHVNLPGLHINTRGDRAEINMPGVHINADGGKARVNVDRPGGRLLSINADEQGAEIRTGDITARNVNATYLLASKEGGKLGDRAVGYVARGPVTGPLVVGVVKSHGFRESHDDLLHAVRRLVRRNVQRS